MSSEMLIKINNIVKDYCKNNGLMYYKSEDINDDALIFVISGVPIVMPGLWVRQHSRTDAELRDAVNRKLGAYLNV